MRTIKLTYEHKTACGNWIVKELTISDGKEYERIINIIHNNPDSYKVVKVEHV